MKTDVVRLKRDSAAAIVVEKDQGAFFGCYDEDYIVVSGDPRMYILPTLGLKSVLKYKNKTMLGYLIFFKTSLTLPQG